MNNISGKVIWITGASSGIGEAIAYAFSAKGARLVLSARRIAALEEVRCRCQRPEMVEILQMDITDVQDLPAKVKWVLSAMGKIDVLINCAGVSQRSLAVETNLEVYRRIMEINFLGTVQLTLAVLPHFKERNEGYFVALSSVAGKVGLPLRTAYCAAKHAIEGFFSSLRTEIWRTNIKILVVRPGAVKTNIAQNALVGDASLFAQKDKVIENGISPEECAAAIVEAIERGETELVVGSAKEKLLFVLNRLMPGFVFNKIKKLGE